MTKSSVASHSSTTASQDASKSTKTGLRLLRYLVLGISINAGIWGLTFLYLKVTKPSYVSKWTLVLPETGSSTKVDIPELGGASSEVKSPYSDRSQDPRSKYQVVAKSDAVIEAAAKKVNLPVKKFGEPRIKVVDNATLMDFSIAGSTPEEARNKAVALQESFDRRLDQLRKEETELKDSSLKKSLNEGRQRLELTQQRLAQFKAQTGLGSKIELEQLSDKITELRKEQADLLAQKEQASANFTALSTNLNLSAKQATDAFLLKTDQLFQQHLKDYSDSTSALTVLNSRFLPDHPSVILEKRKQANARAALLTRSEILLGRPITPEAIAQLNLNTGSANGSARETLLQQLVEVQADAQARQASTDELSKQIAELEARYKLMAQNALTLETLERDARIAEALFSSALTALDVGKTRTGSYPPLQVLIAPDLPDKAATPKKSFALLGAALGSLLVSTGLVSLWLRPYLLRKRQPSKSNPIESSGSELTLIETTAQLEALNLPKRETPNGEKPKSSDQEELRLERR